MRWSIVVTLYSISADYENALAPKTIATESGTRISEPLPIFLNLDILSFDKVDNLNMMFRCSSKMVIYEIDFSNIVF